MKTTCMICLMILLSSSFKSVAQSNENETAHILTCAKKHLINKDTASLHKILSDLEIQRPKASEIYVFFKANNTTIDQIMGIDYSLNQLRGAIGREYFDYLKTTNKDPDWATLKKKLQKKYGGIYAKPFLIARFNFELKKGNPQGVAESGEKLKIKFPEVFSAMLLNNLAFDNFKKSNDQKVLKTLLDWSIEAISMEPTEATYLDTYANILYKLGRKQEAITAIEKAIQLAPQSDTKEFTDNLDKMKQGLPTW